MWVWNDKSFLFNDCLQYKQYTDPRLIYVIAQNEVKKSLVVQKPDEETTKTLL